MRLIYGILVGTALAYMILGAGFSITPADDRPVVVVKDQPATVTPAVIIVTRVPQVAQIGEPSKIVLDLPDAAKAPTPTELPTVAPPIPVGPYVFIDHGRGSSTPRYCLQRPDLGLEVCDSDVSMTYPDTQMFVSRALELHQIKGQTMEDDE